jgi:hypothetical protein
MNFAVHVALFSASNSGLWFVDIIQKANWSWAATVTGVWAILLLAHAIYIFTIANYSPNSNG